MDFKAEINCIPEKKEKYDYILSLGYGEKAACVLAMLTYGSLETACLASIFPREHRLDRIYDWLLEQPNYSSTDIRNYIKEHISELPDAIRKEAEPLLCPENDPRLFGVPTGASAGMGMPGPGGPKQNIAETSVPAVYTLDKKKPVRIEVKKGLTDGNRTEILSGIGEGENVITGIVVPKEGK